MIVGLLSQQVQEQLLRAELGRGMSYSIVGHHGQKVLKVKDIGNNLVINQDTARKPAGLAQSPAHDSVLIALAHERKHNTWYFIFSKATLYEDGTDVASKLLIYIFD